MAIGVSYEDYWYGDPAIVGFAIEAAQIADKRRVMSDDLLAWNTGRYVQFAVGVVLSQAFSKTSTAKYPSEPLIASELDEALAKQKREREIILAHERFLAVARLNAPKGNPEAESGVGTA